MDSTKRNESIITLGVGGTAAEIGTAIDKLTHILEGTLRGGVPGEAPTIDQYLMQLRGARECIERAERQIRGMKLAREAEAS